MSRPQALRGASSSPTPTALELARASRTARDERAVLASQNERPMSVASGVCFGGGASCGDAPHSDGGAPRADDGGAPRDDGGAPRDDGAPPGVKTPCCRRSQRLSIIWLIAYAEREGELGDQWH